MIKDNEKIYDEQIFPLMTKIIAICRENDIPFVASYEYAPEYFCSSAWKVDGQSTFMSKLFTLIRHKAKGNRISTMKLTVTDKDGNETVDVISVV